MVIEKALEQGWAIDFPMGPHGKLGLFRSQTNRAVATIAATMATAATIAVTGHTEGLDVAHGP